MLTESMLCLSFEIRGLMDPINMKPKYKYKFGTNKLLDYLVYI
jgi:hypothetical protein